MNKYDKIFTFELIDCHIKMDWTVNFLSVHQKSQIRVNFTDCIHHLRCNLLSTVFVLSPGKECERIYDCLASGKVSTPSSISTTPRDPRHSGSVPNTPDVMTPRGQMDPRRASLEGRSSSQDAFAFQDPQTPGGIPPPPPPQPQYSGPGMDGPATPGLSGSFHGMKVHDAGMQGQQMQYGNFGQPMLDQYGHPQYPGGMNASKDMQQQGYPHQGNYPASADHTDGYQDPHHGWDQRYQQGHDAHHSGGGGGGFGHQRGNVAADPRQGYGSNQMQPPNAPQQWDQSHHSGSSHTTQESRTHSSHRDSRYSGSHRGRNRTDSKSDSDYHSSRSHHSQRDRHRERRDSFKDRHKSRHSSSSLTRDSSRESTRSDRSQSPPPPAPPPPPPPPAKESAKPASKEPKKDKKEDESSTSLDLRIEQLLNQSKMSFSFDLESSQNSSTSGRRDSIGSETKEEPQKEKEKEIPGSDLYEEFSDEDFEVEQQLEDGESREDTRDSWSSSRGNNNDRGDRSYRGDRGYRDNSRGRHRDYSPDRSRDRYDDRYRDRYRDRDHGRHKKSRKHKWRDDRQRSDRHRGYSKHSRDDSDDDFDNYGSRDKYSDRSRDSFGRRDRRSSLDREDSLDSYRSHKFDQDETSQDVVRKRNSRDQTPIGDDDVQIVEDSPSIVSKNIASLRQGGKESPFGVSSPAVEVSITGTDSQGSTPLTAEPSTSVLMTPMTETSQVSDLVVHKLSEFILSAREDIKVIPQCISSIADVANSKRHQRLDEILIIFTRTIQEIIKVVCKKTCVRNARIHNKLMLYETCALQQAYAGQTELR